MILYRSPSEATFITIAQYACLAFLTVLRKSPLHLGESVTRVIVSSHMLDGHGLHGACYELLRTLCPQRRFPVPFHCSCGGPLLKVR
ncbi:hypothetical protein CCHR01_20036 [Colletotrichum chrysophilum]|uniref:Uncharacterized protein n=1 Tax=Colletotrichum chrysophilum TaxID=1836956 RepID=A0AAD8ZXD1_9PEZI|nr:hypothetical protein CCHR01_20036 [Colletotrichum chrysophilum]